MQFKGEVALVTGAGSGIGKASAMHFAGHGAFVGLLGHTEDELQDTLEAIERTGGEGMVLTADVSNADEMRIAISRLFETRQRLDIVVANAGINGTWAPIDDIKPYEWDRTLAVNLRGTYLTLHHAVPKMKQTGGGAIVIVSSINGTRTFTTPGATAYSVTKAGQLAMAQQLALELGRHNIRINAVCPGKIDTEIHDNTTLRGETETAIPVIWPQGDIPLTKGVAGTAEEVAEVIAFLASDHARHVTGSPIWVDGAQSLLR